MSDYYQDIYSLIPEKEIEPGWWKLKWRPIWKKTYSISWLRNGAFGIGFRTWSHAAHNGWGRSFSHRHLEISFGSRSLNFWIKWNYLVHKDGPLDVPESEKKPLILPKEKLK